MGLFSSLFGCSQKKDTDKKGDTLLSNVAIPVENITPSDDQKERRAKSEKICSSRNIPVYKNPNALFLPSIENVELRSKEHVVDRALALFYIGLKSEGLEQIHLDKLEKAFEIGSKLSPIEKQYAYATHPTPQQQTDANWRYEGLHVMLWALGYIDEIVYPDQMCVVADDVKTIYELGPQKFRDQANLRSKKEILDQADLILRYNWACVSARVKGEPGPGGLNTSVVYERHYALNWIIKNLNQKWDQVTTDT